MTAAPPLNLWDYWDEYEDLPVPIPAYMRLEGESEYRGYSLPIHEARSILEDHPGDLERLIDRRLVTVYGRLVRLSPRKVYSPHNLAAHASESDCPHCEAAKKMYEIKQKSQRYSPDLHLHPGMRLTCLIIPETMQIERVEGAGMDRVVVATCTEGPHKGGKYRLQAPTQYASVRADLWKGWRVEG